MATAAEDLIDRRRLRRKLSFWRMSALVVLALAVVAISLVAGLPGQGAGGRDQIARVDIHGTVTENERLLRLLDRLRTENSVRAVVLSIDSPGGTTAGGEAVYEAVRKIAAVKPVAAEVGGTAASAAYLIASGTDHIVARRTSIVGSIGVLFQYADASKLLDTVGVEVNAIKSAPLKAEPSPFAPAPEAAKDMIRRLVMDTYDWFVSVVAQRRKISLDDARALADGSVFSGRQGLANKLVDAIGGEDEVRRWLESERNVRPGLDFVDRKPEKDGFHWPLFSAARSAIYGALGLDPAAGSLQEAVFGQIGHLDGLVSLWQPSQGRVGLQ
ncbi:signal peptide peptidase SppA [Jiella sp. M17.18]|uniref:signal peptide peptidase SppA n=1 Tax=Jiella sp. M17.18 TaxID=3234247 RepID=UPI0034E01612